LRYSPAGKLPILVDEATVVWESLAICEYAAENFALHHGWPLDYRLRAHARAICSEMHGGFAALRTECGMNVARKPAAVKLSMAASADVMRIKTMWTDCLADHGGPFLYGGFSIADAFYAPVVIRFDRYQLLDEEDKTLRDYVDRMLALPPMQEWIAAGCAETELLPQFEQ
jgi:glutathione S-transferase